MNSRELAIQALCRIDAGAYSNVVVPHLLSQSDLSQRDRGWVTEVVYGVVRHMILLDRALEGVSSRPLDQVDDAPRAALRLGAYELWRGTPAHAAVNETVEAVKVPAPAAAGFVNGILRALERKGLKLNTPDDPIAAIALSESHPEWIVRETYRAFGEEEGAMILRLNNTPANVTLRPNKMRADGVELVAALDGEGAEVALGNLMPEAVTVKGVGSIGELDIVRSGKATPQDQSSQAVVDVLQVEHGHTVLEIGAGPGGKIAAAAELNDDALAVGVELQFGRAKRILQAAERLGVSVDVVQADGLQLPIRGTFDRVLVDAPCSGLGVLRRRPDARYRIQPGDVEELADLQLRLLMEAAPRVALGGRLVYSVCTFTESETAGVVGRVAESFAALGCVQMPPMPPFEPWNGGGMISPARSADGMFMTCWERR